MTPHARDTFGTLYRVYEQYEVIPHNMTSEQTIEYFRQMGDAFRDACNNLGNDRLTVNLAVVLAEQVEMNWKDMYLKEAKQE